MNDETETVAGKCIEDAWEAVKFTATIAVELLDVIRILVMLFPIWVYVKILGVGEDDG